MHKTITCLLLVYSVKIAIAQNTQSSIFNLRPKVNLVFKSDSGSSVFSKSFLLNQYSFSGFKQQNINLKLPKLYDPFNTVRDFDGQIRTGIKSWEDFFLNINLDLLEPNDNQKSFQKNQYR